MNYSYHQLRASKAYSLLASILIQVRPTLKTSPKHVVQPTMQGIMSWNISSHAHTITINLTQAQSNRNKFNCFEMLATVTNLNDTIKCPACLGNESHIMYTISAEKNSSTRPVTKAKLSNSWTTRSGQSVSYVNELKLLHMNHFSMYKRHIILH